MQGQLEKQGTGNETGTGNGNGKRERETEQETNQLPANLYGVHIRAGFSTPSDRARHTSDQVYCDGECCS